MTLQISSSNAAIVTGAARGIGAAIARRLAGDGLAVVVNYASSAGKAEALAVDICSRGGRALAVKADVTVPEQATALFSACEDAFGSVRVLVNNAGLMQPGMVPLAQTDDALFDRIVSTNIKGVFNMLRLAAARMHEGGRIINLSTSQPPCPAGVCRLCRHKVRCGNHDRHFFQRTAGPRHHGECRGPRTNSHGPVF